MYLLVLFTNIVNFRRFAIFDRRVVSIVYDFPGSSNPFLLHSPLCITIRNRFSITLLLNLPFLVSSVDVTRILFQVRWFVTSFAQAYLQTRYILPRWFLLISISTVCFLYFFFYLVSSSLSSNLSDSRRPSGPASISLPPGISLPLSPVSPVFLLNFLLGFF